MAADMDIDMDLDVGIMEEEATAPGIEIMPEIEATVSSVLVFLSSCATQADLPLTRLLNNGQTLQVLTMSLEKTLSSPALKRFTSVAWTI